jgi:cytochrome c biogenesis protein CcdA
MQLGRVSGLVFMGLGGVFTYLAYSMLNDAGVTMKIFIAGPALILLGATMMAFPGGDISVSESRNKIKPPNTWYTEAPGPHKVAWLAALLVGTGVAFAVLPI